MQEAYLRINNLEEAEFIAGTDYSFVFKVYDQDGVAIDLSGAAISWKLCPYGQKNVVSVSKTNIPLGSATNEFIVTLASSDTASLDGYTYIQQPIIQDATGSVFIPGQGIVTIIPKIA